MAINYLSFDLHWTKRGYYHYFRFHSPNLYYSNMEFFDCYYWNFVPHLKMNYYSNHSISNFRLSIYPLSNHHLFNYPLINYRLSYYPLNNNPISNHPLTIYPKSNYPLSNYLLSNHLLSNYPKSNYHLSSSQLNHLNFIPCDFFCLSN
jgi:hypothetical protein